MKIQFRNSLIVALCFGLICVGFMSCNKDQLVTTPIPAAPVVTTPVYAGCATKSFNINVDSALLSGLPPGTITVCECDTVRLTAINAPIGFFIDGWFYFNELGIDFRPTSTLDSIVGPTMASIMITDGLSGDFALDVEIAFETCQ